MGVPGPVLVNISFSSALSMLLRSFRLTLAADDYVCRIHIADRLACARVV
jgi:hypothetical protein